MKERVEYFALVSGRRGSAAASELRQAAIAAWKARESLPEAVRQHRSGRITNA